MYEVSNEIYEQILNEMKEELEEREYNYRDSSLRTILDAWKESKQGLLEMFSKHPNWDAERLMVKFDTDFSREIDTRATKAFCRWLFSKTDITALACQNEEGEMFALCDIAWGLLSNNTYIPETEQCKLNALNSLNENFRFRVGMKSTRVMRKICEAYGWDKITGVERDRDGNLVEFNDFERQYAKYCDALCPIKVTRHTCISLNPIDFLLMSNGNSWDSCHYIGDRIDQAGCYSSGTISYMLDSHSFIFYTVSSDYNGVEIERTPKLQRQVFGYNDNQLLQSRLYPQGNDYGAENQYTDIRNIVQKVVADCCGKPNLWVKRKVINVERGNYATVYNDWYHFSSLCSVSVFKDVADEEHNQIVMGAEPICIECGHHHYQQDNISCCYSDYTCSCCGANIDEDNAYWVGDEPYCRDCVEWCDECQDWYRREDGRYLENYDRWVCDDCLERYYHYCADCDEYVHEYDCTYVESVERYVCNDCLIENFTRCEECEEWIPNDQLKQIVDPETGEVHFYCKDCYDEVAEEEAC